ncbi:MAG: hypothetical protein GY765_22410 [bacterium]|nr:hypothetical protein [bacterium]
MTKIKAENHKQANVPGSPGVEKRKRRSVRLSYDSKLHEIQGVIQNCLKNAELMQLIELYGYNEARMNYALELAERLRQQIGVLHLQKSGQKAITRATREAITAARSIYSLLAATARLAFRDNRGTLDSLQLSGYRKKDIAGFLEQAKAFYMILDMPEALAEILKYNVTVETMEEGKRLLLKAEEADFRQAASKVDTKASTRERNAVYVELRDWVRDFINMSRIALKKHPLLLERVLKAAPYVKT